MLSLIFGRRVGRHGAWPMRLADDRRGAAAVIFGLTFVGLIVFAGVTIDVARLEFVRERLISATDAAALAGGRTINSSGSGNGYMTDASNFFNANFPPGYMGSSNPASPTVTLSSDGTQLVVSETVSLPLMFGQLLGHVSPVPVSYTSTALAGKVEVAMVLDNSGSMSKTVGGDSSSKLSLVQTAAKSFINALTGLNNGNVRIAVVPFTETVNVGSQYQGSSWLDGSASYIYASGVKNAFTGKAFQDVFTDQNGNNYEQNRFTLFGNLKTSWAGCVEMRPAILNADGTTTDYGVIDTLPSSSAPGSLIVPFFAPSEAKTPLDRNGNYTDYSRFFLNHYIDDYGSDDSSSVWQVQQGDYRKYLKPANLQSFLAPITTGARSPYPTPYNFGVFGPNSSCQGFSYVDQSFATQQALSRLSSTSSDSTTTIDGMIPMGDTHLPIGLFWGWQTISPNSVFSDSQANYSDPDITKVIVLLTDGCNHIINFEGTNPTGGCGANSSVTTSYDIPNESVYGSVGYPWQNRIGPLSALAASDLSSDPQVKYETNRQTLADAETLTICTNIKAKGIQIYTIGIDAQGSVNPVLKGCATDDSHYFSTPDPNAASPNNLTAIFANIAAQLTTVRLIAPAGSAPGI